MKLFSDCSGPCETCWNHHCGANCLAGHGDDHYVYVSPEQIEILKEKAELKKGQRKVEATFDSLRSSPPQQRKAISMTRRAKIKVFSALVHADELAEQGDTVMVLLPSARSWSDTVRRCVGSLYDDMSINHPREGVYIRYSNQPSSLRSLPINVLISVEPTNPEWNEQNYLLCQDKLRGVQSDRRKEITIP